MSSRLVHVNVPLSRLVPSRRNPRKVKPSRQSHEQLVALIRTYGLLQPLVIRSVEGKSEEFEVIAGQRRLKALREIHKDDGDPKIHCVRCDADPQTGEAVSLAENFGRADMHPLDEAEAFARLAREDAKGVESIASDFGVSQAYVRQRMKLATLADPVRAAYRLDQIDTATAEAFASVPPDRQLEVWKELNGRPQHAQHVRNVIAHAWIEADRALFDVSALPAGAISRDLFNDRVLVERSAFMEAQAQALLAERQALVEEGWSDVVIGPRADVQDRLFSLVEAPQCYDQATMAKLQKLADRRHKLEAKLQEIDESDQQAQEAIGEKWEALDEEERAIVQGATVQYAEETKAVGTVFLLLDPDGQVGREYRVPRVRSQKTSNSEAGASTDGQIEEPKPLTSDDLRDSQLAVTFTHQALAVREALLQSSAARKRVLALILHEKVRSEALAVRHDANATSLSASHEGLSSQVYERLKERRQKVDPFFGEQSLTDSEAYQRLRDLSMSKLDAVIDLLTAECVTAHLQRRTELVCLLTDELKVNVRACWRPDQAWLASFQKIQLAHLLVDLLGTVHTPSADRKKSDLVEQLAKLFADAAEGRMEDTKLAAKLNSWLPANLRKPLSKRVALED